MVPEFWIFENLVKSSLKCTNAMFDRGEEENLKKNISTKLHQELYQRPQTDPMSRNKTLSILEYSSKIFTSLQEVG